MKVSVLNRKEFEALLISRYDKTLSIEKDEHNCYISIHNYDQDMIEDNCSNFLNLWFDDITDAIDFNAKHYPSCSLFTQQQAKLTIPFCEQNHFKKNLYVHCHAGIARSGAVGTFINDAWGEELFDAFSVRHPWLHPNSYVSMLLMREYREFLVNVGAVK